MNPEAGTPVPAAERNRILIVDDITRNLQVVGTMLRGAGYEIMPTSSGAQALERVRVQAPDLVLLDLMMPDMNGVEVCRRLKSDPATARIPVIMLTASNEMEHLVESFEAGAVDYLTKPFNPPELLARVRTHIELKLARERLREMNEEKNEFLGIAAHDLRNPLSAVKGFAEMIGEIVRELETDPAADRAGALAELGRSASRIGVASARMMEMVQNLLDVNAIERGELPLHPAPTDAAALVASVLDSHRPRAEAKGQTLAFTDEAGKASVVVDRQVALQVLDNLVSNAIKYSPPGKPIEVRLSRAETAVRCSVRDEGPGLTAEDRRRLFGKFARLSARPTGGEQSTGLGLSIVKRLVEALRGRVWCESVPGQGATFLVEFPAA